MPFQKFFVLLSAMTRVRRVFLFLLFFIESFVTVSAQTTPAAIVEQYTTAEGLPSNNVMCVLKDRDGFVWFGTWYGLCRFDGGKFFTYNKPLKAYSDIPPRKIENIVEDAQGRLWLKTVDWKLYTFDRLTERFHAVYDELKKHTRHLQVIKIQRTEDGKVLLLMKDKTLLLASTNKQGEADILKLVDTQGKIDAQTLQLQEDIISVSQGYEAYVGRDYSIFIQPKGKQSLAEAMAKSHATEQQHYERLAQICAGTGINRYLQLYQDQDSILWITTASEGVYSLSMPRKQFNLIPLPDEDLTGVRCLYQTHQGNIIVGARSRNAYIYDMDGQLQQTLPYNTYGLGAIYHATEDQQGRLWLSTKGDGLVLAVPDASQPLGYRLTHYCHQPDDPTSISGNDVYMTYIDSYQHIWVGTLDGGLNLVNEKDGMLSFYNKQNGLKNYPAYGLYTEIRNIVEDMDGCLWVGTIDGLMSINCNFNRPEDVQFKTYRDQPEATFANNDIYTLYRDLKGQIWIGAFGGGLQKLGVGPLGPREGLRNDVIFSIIEDLQGHLWFATEAGLSRYNQQTKRIRNFDQYDGIPHVKMEEASALCCTNGQMWIGCKQGILTFNPHSLQTDKTDYRTFIMDVKVDGQPFIGEVAIPYTKEIELPYHQNSITLEFAALKYKDHAQLNYRYQLKGYDKDWHYAASQRTASYNKIPSGNYTFIVETIDDNNPTLHSTAECVIHILTPWWATWWAYGVYFILAGLIAWVIIRTVLKMNRMRNEIYISQRLAKLTSKPDEGDEFIDQLHRIIRSNIPNTEFNVETIASEMGLSRSAFYKKTKSLTGFAPIDLIKEFRLSRAKELLETTNLSIAEVAFRSGFADSSYLGKCFKKRYGVSPREFLHTEPVGGN